MNRRKLLLAVALTPVLLAAKCPAGDPGKPTVTQRRPLSPPPAVAPNTPKPPPFNPTPEK